MATAQSAPALPPAALKLRQLSRITEIPAATWDALFPPDYPFAHHAFLSALERFGCAVARTGWQPCHAVLEDATGVAIAVAPLYFKAHSFGEFVFDFAWARASEHSGVPYYPKLTCAVPFTPVAGSRIGARDPAARAHMAQQLAALAPQLRCSSLHALFLSDDDCAAFAATGCFERHDIQFHWHNDGYTDFADFLSRLTHVKRKKILQERRRVRDAGVTFRWRAGDELSQGEWRDVYELYAGTYAMRGQYPYWTPEFLSGYGGAAGSPLRLICGYEGARLVAVAILMQGGNTLYGRHWGAAERYSGLHFETCYYQGIEWCIRERLARYDAGTQGEHKVARGFAPVITRSAHALTDPALRRRVAAAVEVERVQVEAMRQEYLAHGPWRTPVDGPHG